MLEKFKKLSEKNKYNMAENESSSTIVYCAESVTTVVHRLRLIMSLIHLITIIIVVYNLSNYLIFLSMSFF